MAEERRDRPTRPSVRSSKLGSARLEPGAELPGNGSLSSSSPGTASQSARHQGEQVARENAPASGPGADPGSWNAFAPARGPLRTAQSRHRCRRQRADRDRCPGECRSALPGHESLLRQRPGGSFSLCVCRGPSLTLTERAAGAFEPARKSADVSDPGPPDRSAAEPVTSRTATPDATVPGLRAGGPARRPSPIPDPATPGQDVAAPARRPSPIPDPATPRQDAAAPARRPASIPDPATPGSPPGPSKPTVIPGPVVPDRGAFEPPPKVKTLGGPSSGPLFAPGSRARRKGQCLPG